MMELLILVDENGDEVGVGEKLQVHREGRLHRAFSIFVFHPDGRLMLQRRAKSKYHSGGLWSNTCCGHPRPGEGTLEAAHRRLRDEMNFDCELRYLSNFTYRAELDNQLVEWEFDNVFVGTYDQDPRPNAAEAEGWRWIDVEELKAMIRQAPGDFTYWLRVALENLEFTPRADG
ncbi:MAG: isopentenyl-diphosphate Delta-isomerase [Acidobacteriota bacterium]|nr:isopentenyl-diphosphate Delta-isomerase [Acidobacteriota bacterium]